MTKCAAKPKTPPVNWPTEPGWYLVENLGYETIDSPVQTPVYRLLDIHVPRLSYEHDRQWLRAGEVYVWQAERHGGGAMTEVHAFCSMDGHPWGGLRFRGPLPLAQIAALYDGGQC